MATQTGGNFQIRSKPKDNYYSRAYREGGSTPTKDADEPSYIFNPPTEPPTREIEPSKEEIASSEGGMLEVIIKVIIYATTIYLGIMLGKFILLVVPTYFSLPASTQSIDLLSTLDPVTSTTITKLIKVSQQTTDNTQTIKQISVTTIKSRYNINEIESSIHELMNQQRKTNGLIPLKFDVGLSNVARKHSQEMAKNNYFNHVDLSGGEVGDRLETAGISCIVSGENIHTNEGYPSSQWAITTVTGLMNSPPHRENILSNKYESEGIGVEIVEGDNIYVTQVFCGNNCEPGFHKCKGTCWSECPKGCTFRCLSQGGNCLC